MIVNLDEIDLKSGLLQSIPLLLNSIDAYDYSKLRLQDYEDTDYTVASVMPKLLFVSRQTLFEHKKAHKLKASTEDDVLEKGMTKFFGLDDIKDVISVFQRRHLICAGNSTSESNSQSE